MSQGYIYGCFSGWVVWRQQCSEMYDGSNALQKHIQTVEVGYKQKSRVVGRHTCLMGVYGGLHASRGVWRPKCFSGVWRQHWSSKIYAHIFSKEYFCEVNPTCVSSKALRVPYPLKVNVRIVTTCF